MNILKTVQHLHILVEHHLSKHIWEKNRNRGSASHLLPDKPSQAQSCLLKTVGALCLDLLCREPEPELKSIDAVCSCDCLMHSRTGVAFECNLQASSSFRWFSKACCALSLWLPHLFSPYMRNLQLRTKVLKARTRAQKAQADTNESNMPIARYDCHRG